MGLLAEHNLRLNLLSNFPINPSLTFPQSGKMLIVPTRLLPKFSGKGRRRIECLLIGVMVTDSGVQRRGGVESLFPKVVQSYKFLISHRILSLQWARLTRLRILDVISTQLVIRVMRHHVSSEDCHIECIIFICSSQHRDRFHCSCTESPRCIA